MARLVTTTHYLEEVKRKGGLTLWNSHSTYVPYYGYVVSREGYEQQFQLSTVTEEDLVAYANEHMRTGHVGFWVDGDVVYADTNDWYSDHRRAELAARLNHQKAYYCLSSGQVHNTGDYNV